MTKKHRLDKRKDNLNALVTFIKPVHKSISESLDLTALASVAEISARDAFVISYERTSKEKGVIVTQALIYEKLLMADVCSVDLDHSGFKRDSIYFKEFSDELKAAGMFNRAKAIDLMLAKMKLVTNIKDVFVSKLAQKARKLKAQEATHEEIESLDEYLIELKEWAIRTYSLDCEQRKASGQKIRVKTKGPNAADKWLYQMAMKDLNLNENSFLDLSDEELRSLPDDGTLHGSPEPPNNLLDFKLSVRFFYNQIKNKIK
ncbi:MAG: hypothetical protein HRT53_08225 [Colwellia sp.]|nr:hypothetical protein [Colwellia sp.]